MHNTTMSTIFHLLITIFMSERFNLENSILDAVTIIELELYKYVECLALPVGAIYLRSENRKTR